MSIKNGDFVRLEYTAKIKETGDIFATTNEEIAREANIFVEEKNYAPLPIVVGGNHLLKSLDDAIIGMEEGESKNLSISPEEGYGERDPKKIELISMSEFKKQGIKPYVGMGLTLEGEKGKILTISSGRVRVDFNNELAGKYLEYDLVISEIIESDEEKIKAMIQLHYPHSKMDLNKTVIKIDGKNLSINLDDITKYDQRSYTDITLLRFRIAKDIWTNMDFESVDFVDKFEKTEEKEEKSSNEENAIGSEDVSASDDVISGFEDATNVLRS